MAYNLSRATVKRKLRVLDEMYRKRRTLTFPARDPSKLAYQIREALEASRHHPEYEKYGRMKKYYTVKALEGWVETRWDGESEEPEQTASIPDIVRLPEVVDLVSIIGGAIKFGTRADEIYYPDARLEETELEKLYQWCRQPGWNIINQEELGITLTKRSDVDDVLLWEPARDVDAEYEEKLDEADPLGLFRESSKEILEQRTRET